MPTKTILKGFLTIELMIALALFTVMTAGAFGVAFGGQTMSLDVGLSKGGVGHALSSIQTASQGASALAGFNALSDTSDTSGFYDETQEVSTIAPCMKALEHRTFWDTEHNRSLSVGLATLVASLDVASALGGDCDPFPPTEWDNPESYGSVDIGGAEGTGVAARSIGGTRYAFLTASPSAAGQDDLYIYDVEDAQNPSEAASVNTGVGLNGLAAAGTYLFAIQNSNVNQLQVIDVSDPSAPSVSAEVPLPNFVYTCSPPSSPCLAGRSIAYFDDTVYVGTGYLAFGTPPLGNNEFHVFDVSSPSAPVWRGSVNVNHNVNDIAVYGDYAYLATSDNSGELWIVDVSDPTSPSFVAKYDAPWSANDAQTIEVLDEVVYLGRDRAASSDYDFLTIDVSVPSAPSLLGRARLSMNPNTAITGLDVQGKYAFIGTSDTNDEFRIYDVSDPTSPSPYGCPPYNYSARVADLVYADGYIFTANESNDALRIIYDDPFPGCN
jgi:hypothetical protein